MIVFITSAAYVNPEMAAEIGLIPPAFLPLGTQRLIDHQVASLRRLEDVRIDSIFLSLPKSINLDEMDRRFLEQAGVECIFVPDDYSLGQSVSHCLDQAGMKGPIAILHGDTLVDDESLTQALTAPSGNSCVVAPAPGSYSWGRAFVRGGRFMGALSEQYRQNEISLGKRDVLVGLFSFNDCEAFHEALQFSNCDFVTALSRMAFLENFDAVECRSWTDFGHLQTYYSSRAAFASTRAFNNLQIADGVVRKSGKQRDKIRAEAHWFERLPTALKHYSARLIDTSSLPGGLWQYQTEYEYLPTLQELFVFGRLPDGTWGEIISACCQCLNDFAATPVPNGPVDALQTLTQTKTWERIEAFEAERGIDMRQQARLGTRALPSPRAIAEQMISIIATDEAKAATVMHGDFCFSNIMFNGRTRNIRLIDPRGTLDGKTFTCGGDVRYDMAKLAHSVIGFYDLIIAGHVRCRHDAQLNFDITFHPTPEIERLTPRFADFEVAGYRFGDPLILATMILLFLSMLPLHADRPDRQDAFLANALRLYAEYF